MGASEIKVMSQPRGEENIGKKRAKDRGEKNKTPIGLDIGLALRAVVISKHGPSLPTKQNIQIQIDKSKEKIKGF